MTIRRLITARQAFTNSRWLGSMLGGESFKAVRVLMIAAMGEAHEPDELAPGACREAPAGCAEL